MLDKILDEMYRLRTEGCSPDTVAFSPAGYKKFADFVWDRWHTLIPPGGGEYSGMKIKMVLYLKEDFRVYQSRTKLDPTWPHEYLASLAVNSLDKGDGPWR